MTDQPINDQPVNDDLVTIKTVTTSSEAEIICAVLDDHGIRAFIPDANASAVMPHMFTAVNTWGVKVQVAARDAEAAGEILQLSNPNELAVEDDDTDHAEPESDLPLADQYAKRLQAALVSLLFQPLLLWSIYCAWRARKAARIAPPSDKGKYRKNLLLAMTICVLMFALTLWIVSIYTEQQLFAR